MNFLLADAASLNQVAMRLRLIDKTKATVSPTATDAWLNSAVDMTLGEIV